MAGEPDQASMTGECPWNASTTCQREIGVFLPNNQRQNRTLHIQKDVLPYALC